jgi:hypothetical protein
MNFCRFRLTTGSHKNEICGAAVIPEVDQSAETIVCRVYHPNCMFGKPGGVHAYKPLKDNAKYCYFHDKLMKGLFDGDNRDRKEERRARQAAGSYRL